MTLVIAVTNILCRRVTEEEAKEFALKNYGVLCAYIRSNAVTEILANKGIKVKQERKGKRLLITKSNKTI